MLVSANNHKQRATAIRSVRVAVALWLALGLLWAAPFWQLVDNRAFDFFATLFPGDRADHVVVVAIDEPSFAEIGRGWPWPRSLHGRLIESLHRAGAAAIGLDLLFAEPSAAEEDAALASAVRAAGPTVMAGQVSVVETPQAVQEIETVPLPMLTDAGARTGIASVVLDGDDTLRRLPPYPKGFADALVGLYCAATGRPSPSRPEGPALLRFAGADHAIPTVSYYQALDPERYLPPGFFRGKIVIVGLDLLNTVDPRAPGPDRFATPFTLTTGRLTAGAEIHATIAENLLSGSLITLAPPQALLMFSAVLAAVSLYLFRDWHPLPAGRRLVILWLVLLAGSFSLLHFARLWVAPPLPLLAVSLPFLVEGGGAFLRERAQKRQISLAFGRYLAPALVERLIREPERLKLGGETRQMSIMFCDIRGFTTLSERFREDPQGLTQLINRFLTPMTEAILEHGGTIDKYIGDCIMAFWNAPLDDAEHAVHACQAALAMFRRLEGLNATLAGEAAAGSVPLRIDIGIGINDGPCVVGNLGSDQRFDYSVLGDAVNLASRLEGTSKMYGTGIVVGEETWAAASSHFAGLELDRIAVKGKSQAVRIYTILGDKGLLADPAFAALAERHASMLAAYRSREWAAAQSALAECRRSGWLGHLYDLYEARIAAFLTDPPAADWDGVYVATSK